MISLKPPAASSGRRMGPHAILGRGLWPAYGCAFVLCGGVNLLLLAPTLYVMQILDRVLSSRSVETLTSLTLIAGVSLLAYGGLEWARGRLMSRLGQWLEGRLGTEVVEVALDRQLNDSPVGAQGLRDLQIVKSFYSNRPAMAVFDAPWGLLFVGVLWLLHPWLGGFCFISIVLLVALAAASEVLTAPLQLEADSKHIALLRWCEHAIGQAEIVTALGMRAAVIRRYTSTADALHTISNSASARLETAACLSRTIRQIMQLSIMALSAWLALGESLSSGGVVASSILLSRALAPFDQLIASWRHFAVMRDARRRLCAMLQTSLREGHSPLPKPRGQLSAQRLTVRSPLGNHRWLLQDVSFEISPGQGLGVIGPSGAGKSTLCRVAAGLIRPDIGDIRLDGARFDMWDSDTLGAHVGYLPQDVGLVPATVAETIARLNPDAASDLVHAAAAAAGAHELILGLPAGYDTLVGPGGIPLSGGQRQRIGLARALFGDPVLLILDEPDAHLDLAGEQALHNAIGQAKARGTAVMLIVQRPGMIKLMDQVLVLQNGKAAQYGPRADILRSVMRKEQGAL